MEEPDFIQKQDGFEDVDFEIFDDVQQLSICSICNVECEYEVCDSCICTLEGTDSQIQSYNFEEELNLMDIAIDRSLDEHPEFLEVMELTKRKSLEEVERRRKAIMEYNNRHYNPKIRKVSIKNVCYASGNQALMIDGWLLNEMWNRWVTKCYICQKDERNCIHLTPYEYEFFWKLIPLSKRIRELVLTFLKENGIGAVAGECYCCLRFCQNKIKAKIPSRWIENSTHGKYWSDNVIKSTKWHRFVQKIRSMGLKTFVINCRFKNL